MAKAKAARAINLIISFLPCLRLLAEVLRASTLRQIKSSIRLLRSALNLSHNATSDEGQSPPNRAFWTISDLPPVVAEQYD